MYISEKAIYKLKIYLVVLSFVFVGFFIFTTIGIQLQDIAYNDYYYNDYSWGAVEGLYNWGGVFLSIGSIFLFVGMIMVFVITGIIFFIKRFKMSSEEVVIDG